MGCGASSKVHHGTARALDDYYAITTQIQSFGDSTLFSVVRVDTGKSCVAKVVSRKTQKERFNKDGVSLDVEVMRKLRHPHCASIHEVLDEGDIVNIILHLPTWIDLASHIVEKKRLTENDAAFVSAQLAGALHYMHSQGVCHRDLSPHSVTVVSNQEDSPNYLMVMISDFGKSSMECVGYNEIIAQAVEATPFSAPELVKFAVYGRNPYSCKVDIWSLGIVLYTMLCGSHPFSRMPPDALEEAIIAADVPFREGPFRKVWDGVSKDCVDFVKRCTRLDARKRPTATECKTEAWLREGRRHRPEVSSWGSQQQRDSQRASRLSSRCTQRGTGAREAHLDAGWGSAGRRAAEAGGAGGVGGEGGGGPGGEGGGGPGGEGGGGADRRSLAERTWTVMHGGDTPPSRESSARSRQSQAGADSSKSTMAAGSDSSKSTMAAGSEGHRWSDADAGSLVAIERRTLRAPGGEEAGVGAKGGGGGGGGGGGEGVAEGEGPGGNAGDAGAPQPRGGRLDEGEAGEEPAERRRLPGRGAGGDDVEVFDFEKLASDGHPGGGGGGAWVGARGSVGGASDSEEAGAEFRAPAQAAGAR